MHNRIPNLVAKLRNVRHMLTLPSFILVSCSRPHFANVPSRNLISVLVKSAELDTLSEAVGTETQRANALASQRLYVNNYT